MTSNAPADSAKNWFVNNLPSASGAIVYNVPGSEKTIIAGKSSGAYGHMLQLNYDDTYLRILRYVYGSWKSTDWEKISAGYSDSAGNADTIDGLHYSSFLRKDTNDSTPYQYTFTKTNDHAIRVGTIRGKAVGSQTGDYIHLYERVAIGSPSGWGSRPAPSYGLATYGGAWLATDTGNVGIGTTNSAYKLHVAGDIYTTTGFKKEGSSDSYVLLGGGGHYSLNNILHGDSYGTMKGVISDCNSVSVTGIYSSSGFTNRPSGVVNWGTLFNLRLYDSNNLYHRQLFFDCYASDRIWTRSNNGGSWTSWKELITSANISSQSVSYATSAGNADTLDGIDSTGFGYNKTSNNYDLNEVGTHFAAYRFSSAPSNTFSDSAYGNTLVIGAGSDTMTQIGGPYHSQELYFRNGTWYSNGTGSIRTQGWNRILHSSNYTDYTVKKDGIGASGTWNISITGNAATATNTDMIDGQHLMTQVSDWNTDSLSIFKSSERSSSNAPTTDYTYGVTLRFHRDSDTYYTDLVTSLYYDRLFFRRKEDKGYMAWRELIHSGNIGLQSVSYATSASNADTATKVIVN